ncbi:glycosyltransferase family 4 protein [Blastococcus deserti]|uniref:Glycosyltransferase family 4 protein n=1 Tax=Blastococcus deserti TaxID=2259033 RepID=A0ABW4X5K9_9ACTN
MRVAMVVEQILAPLPGGTGRYTAEVAEALAAVAPTGCRVTGWVAAHRRVGAARLRGVRGPRRLPLSRRALTLAWERGVPLVPTGADVVHAPTLLAPPRAGRPLVVTVHDAVPWTHPETLTPRGVRWHRAMAERVGRSADAVVVPTAAVARELRRWVALPERVVVAGAGVSGRLARPDDAADRAVRAGAPRDGYFLSVATLEPRKGLDVLLAALAAMPHERRLPLVLVGQPGWGGVQPLELARDLGLRQGDVVVLGRLPDPDLAAVMAAAVAVVVPSRAEGFGLPVVEAMAAGTPVVTSDDPALVEVGGDATFVAPIGDVAALAAALTELVDGPGLRRDMAARGLARAGQFTWERTARTLWDLYRDLPR